MGVDRGAVTHSDEATWLGRPLLRRSWHYQVHICYNDILTVVKIAGYSLLCDKISSMLSFLTRDSWLCLFAIKNG